MIISNIRTQVNAWGAVLTLGNVNPDSGSAAPLNPVRKGDEVVLVKTVLTEGDNPSNVWFLTRSNTPVFSDPNQENSSTITIGQYEAYFRRK